MKKFRKILKRTAVGFLTVAMLVTSVDLSSLTVKAAGPDDKYAGEYTIESLLSQYEYFISGDADIYKHTVGSVAIGGELTQHDESIGNAAQYPFYIGKADEVYYSIEALDGIEPGEGAKTVYYLDGQVKSWNRGNTKMLYGKTQALNAPYFDFTKMESIRSQAESVSLASRVIQEKDLSSGNILTIDVNVTPNITIPYSIFSKEGFKINFINVSDYGVWKNGAYSIAITGVESEKISLVTPILHQE